MMIPVWFLISVMSFLLIHVAAAARPGSLVDVGMAGISTLGLSVPEFWLAIILILIFSVHWQIFPVAGFVGLASSPSDWFMHIFLAAFTIGLVQSALISRIVRNAVLDT